MELLDRPVLGFSGKTCEVAVTRLWKFGECPRRYALILIHGCPPVRDLGRFKGDFVHHLLASASTKERTDILHREAAAVQSELGSVVAAQVTQQCTDMADWATSALRTLRFSQPIQPEFTLKRLDAPSRVTIRCQVDGYVNLPEPVVIEYKSGAMPSSSRLGPRVDFQTMFAAWCGMRTPTCSVKRVVLFLGSKEMFIETLTASQMVTWVNSHRGLLKSYLKMMQQEEAALSHAIARPGKHCTGCEWVNRCPSAHKE